MIIDTVMFYNEINMLNFRMHELNLLVDYFVVVESNFTFQGKPKSSIFIENLDVFKPFLHKVILLTADGVFNGKKWFMEENQRDYPRKFLLDYFTDPNDVFIITDTDEVPSLAGIRKAIEILRNNPNSIYVGMDFDVYFYNFKTMATEPSKCGFICNRGALMVDRICDLRVRAAWERNLRVRDAGWHLTNFLTPEQIRNKLENYSHSEYNNEKFTDIERINYLIENQLDLFQRDESEFKLIKATKEPLPVYKHLLE